MIEMNKGKKWQLDMIQIESGNNMNKRERIPIIKKRETPAPHNACNPLQVPDQQ